MQSSIKVGISLLVLGAGIARADANLVLNGGFETGDFTSWTTTAAGSGSLFSVNDAPNTGAFGASFGAVDGLADTIEQAILTTVGMSYHIDFWVRTDNSEQIPELTEPSLLASTHFFQATFGGVTLLTLVDNPGAPYTQYSGDVVATSSSSLLQFQAFNGPSWYRLDDVSVTLTDGTPVPETSTSVALAFVSGLAGFTIWRRRVRA